MKYKFLEHTADVQYEAYGETIEECFLNSSEAMIVSICDSEIKGDKKKELKISGDDFENLLYEFLEEILFIFESENLILSGIENLKIDKSNFELTCSAFFDDSSKYDFFSHVKAITYNEMKVEKQNNVWVSKVTLDV